MKLHLVTGNDELRPVFDNVYLDKDNAVATDTHVLVCIPKRHIFKDIELPNMFIKGKDWKKLFSKLPFRFEWTGEYLISYDKKQEIINIVRPLLEDNSGFKYPYYKKIIPEGKEPLDTIGIDLKLAERVNKALNVSGLEMSFYGVNRSIILKPLGDELKDAWGLIMPKMLK